jgi:hypothetical protein
MAWRRTAKKNRRATNTTLWRDMPIVAEDVGVVRRRTGGREAVQPSEIIIVMDIDKKRREGGGEEEEIEECWFSGD